MLLFCAIFSERKVAMKTFGMIGMFRAAVFSVQTGIAADDLDFSFSKLNAGRAMLSENGFTIVKRLGTANFSEELQIPVELVYSSTRKESGMFGYAWWIPQLESSTLPAPDGMVWTTPWGEEIRFFSPSKVSGQFKEVFQGDSAKKDGYFAPYADWEATPLEKDARKGGNWKLTGIRGYKGWGFLYQDAKLIQIKTPCGRNIQFRYAGGGVLKSVSQDNVPFIEIQKESGCIEDMTLNGILHKFIYENTMIPVLPQTLVGRRDLKQGRKHLRHWLTQGIPGTSFGYDDSGYPSWISQGGKREELTVESESVEDRIASLTAKQNKVKNPDEKVSGRLLADGRYLYRYKGTQTGHVELTDRGGGVTTYDFSAKTGTLSVTEPSGQKTTVYYFMRHDVPYLGKVRKVVDSQGREVVSYRYDSRTGKIAQIRNNLGNDTNFTYDENGGLAGISRQSKKAKNQEQILSVRSDTNGNPLEIAILDEKGSAVQTTRIAYGREGMPTRVDDGRGAETYVYSKSGYPIQKTDRFGLVTRIEYDRYNRVQKISTPDGYDTVITRNPGGFVSRVERRDESGVCASVDIAYDHHGAPAKYTTEDGRTRSLERDSEGRIIRDRLPDGAIISYAYDEIGKLTSILDSNGCKRSIEYSDTDATIKRVINAEGHINDYFRSKGKGSGLVARITSRLKSGDKAITEKRYAYDSFGRLVKSDSGREGYSDIGYDEWGRVVTIICEGRKAFYRYDFFGGLTDVTDGDTEEMNQYNEFGQRISRITKRNNKELWERRGYDQFGRLSSVETQNGRIDYSYDSKNRLAIQRIGKYQIRYTYTPHNELATKTLYSPSGKELGTLAYRYKKNGRISGRTVNGMRQDYVYDKMDRLVCVLGENGKCLERYSYDKRGNIVEKETNGKKAVFTYNRANQLVRKSFENGKDVEYRYDALGRLIREGDRTYTYNSRNKITAVFEQGKRIAAYSYTVSGQIASITRDGNIENFVWDGLALIERNGKSVLNDPYPNGGTPVLLGTDTVLLTDILGTTVGMVEGEEYRPINQTMYGETDESGYFFSGKPFIQNLGYSFVLRNYRPELGRWQNPDPFGFPDGWNNYVYCNGKVTTYIDRFGGKIDRVGPGGWQNYDGYTVFILFGTDSYLYSYPIGTTTFTYMVDIRVEVKDTIGVTILSQDVLVPSNQEFSLFGDDPDDQIRITPDVELFLDPWVVKSPPDIRGKIYCTWNLSVFVRESISGVSLATVPLTLLGVYRYSYYIWE